MMKDIIGIIVLLVIIVGLFAIWGMAMNRCERKGGAYVGGICIKAQTITIFGKDE